MDKETLKYFQSKSTEELNELVEKHNTHIYKEEAFEIMRNILNERNKESARYSPGYVEDEKTEKVSLPIELKGEKGENLSSFNHVKKSGLKIILPLLMPLILIIGIRLPSIILKNKIDKDLKELHESGVLDSAFASLENNEYLNKSKSSNSSSYLEQNDNINQVGSASLTYTNKSHGFQIKYPADWTKKEGITENTLFKISKKLPDGHSLVVSINVQLLNQYGLSMAEMELDDIIGTITSMFGEKNVNILRKERCLVSGIPAVELLYEINLPEVGPYIQSSLLLIKGRNYYTIGTGCVKAIYPTYESQFNQILASFYFSK